MPASRIVDFHFCDWFLPLEPGTPRRTCICVEERNATYSDIVCGGATEYFSLARSRKSATTPTSGCVVQSALYIIDWNKTTFVPPSKGGNNSVAAHYMSSRLASV